VPYVCALDGRLNRFLPSPTYYSSSELCICFWKHIRSPQPSHSSSESYFSEIKNNPNPKVTRKKRQLTNAVHRYRSLCLVSGDSASNAHTLNHPRRYPRINLSMSVNRSCTSSMDAERMMWFSQWREDLQGTTWNPSTV